MTSYNSFYAWLKIQKVAISFIPRGTFIGVWVSDGTTARSLHTSNPLLSTGFSLRVRLNLGKSGCVQGLELLCTKRKDPVQGVN